MCSSVVAITEISTLNSRRMMLNFGYISKKCLRHRSFGALGARLGKKLIWNDGVMACVLYHPAREDQLIPPVEVGFKEADRAQLVYIIVSTYLFEQHR